MESIILNVLKTMVEEQLAPLLFGAFATLVAVFIHWKLPEQFEAIKQRIIRIEKRQKVLATMVQELLDKQGKPLDIQDFETLFSDDETDESSQTHDQ